MASRRGRGGSTSSRGKPKKTTPEYIGGESDLRYADVTRRRLRQEAGRRWTIRIAILAILVFVGWMWGPSLLQYLRTRGQSAARQVEKTGKGLRAGVEQRTGGGLEEEP